MHLTDRRIVAFARREGPPLVRRLATRHLERCPECRTRLGQLHGIRSLVRDATRPEVPDRFDDVLARLDAGEVVLLPGGASEDPVRSRPIGRRVATWIGALALSAAGAFAAVAVLGPPATTTAPAHGSSGLAAPVADSFVVSLDPPIEATTVRVLRTNGSTVEVTATGGSSRVRFESGPRSIRVRDISGGEIRVSVPWTARAFALRVGDGRVIEIDAPERLESDSALTFELAPSTGGAP